MKEPLNKGTDEEPIFRVRWSELDRYIPFKIIITDWKNLKVVKYGNAQFLLLPSEMEYKNRKIELCVPYGKFINKIRDLPLEQQRWIVIGKAVIELMKTYHNEHYGMRVVKVTQLP